MASLMGEIDKSPEMQEKLDAMMEDLSAGLDGEGDSKGPGTKEVTEAVDKAAAKMFAQPGTQEDPFQEKIRKTMERIHASGEQAGAAAAAAASPAAGGGIPGLGGGIPGLGGEEQDLLEALLKEMGGAAGAAAGAGGEGGEGEGEEDFSQMLLGMMEQLTNKEILYEPMKDLQAKFPPWMQEHRATTGADDLRRYDEQRALVDEIVARFERVGYSDGNTADREFIVQRMQKVRACVRVLPFLSLSLSCLSKRSFETEPNHTISGVGHIRGR